MPLPAAAALVGRDRQSGRREVACIVGVTFSDDQWQRLQAAFPGGVCDWSKPGVAQQPSIPWITYADGPGGRPVGPAPSSRAFGCLPRRVLIGRRSFGRLRLGITRRRALRRLPPPVRRSRRSLRWCVAGSLGTVRAVFNGRGRLALVASTVGGHGNRGVRPGIRERKARRAYPRRRRISGAVFRVARRSHRVVGLRGRRVRFVGVGSRRVLRSRRALRGSLRLAGLRRSGRAPRRAR